MAHTKGGEFAGGGDDNGDDSGSRAKLIVHRSRRRYRIPVVRSKRCTFD